MTDKEPNRVVTFLLMALNVFCVVSIVVFNKILYKEYHFTYPNTLVTIHFAFTATLLWISADVFKLFEPRRPPWKEIFNLSLSQVGSVAFVNLSLVYNSLSLYQVLKLLNIPLICIIEYYFYDKSYTTTVTLSLLIILIGIGLATVTEVEFSAMGIFYGLLATIATAVYQILAQTKQKEYSINAQQMLYYQAPLTTLMLGALALLSDNISGLMSYQFTWGSMSMLTVTGFIAFGVNLSLFLILGRASPVTYQVVGHFKTCLVIFFGFIALNQPFDAKNFVGIIVALGGMIWYTHLRSPRPSGTQVAAPIERENLITTSAASDTEE